MPRRLRHTVHPCIITAMTAHVLHAGGTLPADLHARVSGDLMAYMGRHRISQRRVAASIGVDSSTVSRWLNKDMSVADLERLLTALGLTAKLSLYDSETGELTLATVHSYLKAVPGSGTKTPTSATPLLFPVNSN